MTLSEKIFSPIRLPPPGFEKKLRPSSAARRDIAESRLPSRSATARGSKTTVYLPGASSRGFALSSAFFAARRASSSAGIEEKSGASSPAQPEPVPSSVRIVVENPAVVDEEKPKFPFLLASAAQRVAVSENPDAASFRPRAEIERRPHAVLPLRRAGLPRRLVRRPDVRILLRYEPVHPLRVDVRRGHHLFAPGDRAS